MIQNHIKINSLYYSIGILSVAIIGYQLVLMQLLSIVQWHHFAYMIISVALLGFGCAGTVITIFKSLVLKHAGTLMPLCLFISAITMSVAFRLANHPDVMFDTYLLFNDYTRISRLLITYLLFFLPFFFGAIVIGVVFTMHTGQIGKLYFANMLGSGIGGVGVVILFRFLLPQSIVLLLAGLIVVSGMLIVKKTTLCKVSALISIVTVFLLALFPSALNLSEYKSFSKTKQLPGAIVEMERSSPYGLVQVVSSPVLRNAPGVSLAYNEKVPVHKALFVNGNWSGSIAPLNDSSHIMNYTSNALPYFISTPGKVLILEANTGADVIHASMNGTKDIVAIEANKNIIEILKTDSTSKINNLLISNSVNYINQAPRTYLQKESKEFDLIVMPSVGTFGGSSGINAIEEQYLLTSEAFDQMWGILSEKGMICITCWNDFPVRNSLKILTTIKQTMRNAGIEDFEKHFVVIKSWGTMTFLLKYSPFSENELLKVSDFCEKMYFDPLLPNNLAKSKNTSFNQAQDLDYSGYINKILSSDGEKFIDNYDFSIAPASDNRPFFSQFIKLRNIKVITKSFGSQTLPFLEIGYIVLLITLVQTILIAILLVLLPLFRIRTASKYKFPVFLYFSGIGIGYMFLEIVLIQQTVLYVGTSIYSAAIIISCLLIFSGIGSYYSSKIQLSCKNNRILFLTIILQISVLAFVLVLIYQKTILLPLYAKIGVIIVCLFPLAFLMGMPFPVGLRMLNSNNQGAVPWAWGINSYFSVISASLATVLAVEFGFQSVFIFAALAYCLPFVLIMKYKK